jgi:hypothetical protein
MLSLFRLPGHELTIPSDKNKSFLNGKASDISFFVSGKTPKFEANQFSASLSQESNKK